MRFADPQYPREALRVLQPGWVIVEFDIVADGSTANLKIAASSPKGVFEAAGLESVRRSTYPTDNPLQGCRSEIGFNYEK